MRGDGSKRNFSGEGGFFLRSLRAPAGCRSLRNHPRSGVGRIDFGKISCCLTKFCKTVLTGYNGAMKPVSLSLGLLALLFSLNSCQVPGKQATNVGPFDSNGNYVEAWANDPSKWRAYSPKDVDADPPKIAKNEQPPDHSVPLTSGPVAPTTHVVASSHSRTTATRSGTKTKTKAKADAGRTVAKRTSKGDSEPEVRSTAKPKSDTEPEVKSSTKPKDKPSVVKSKTKGKPTTTGSRHTVKSGDSLSSIAASHGTTVSALKKANGLTSDKLRDGKTLVIPHSN